MARNEKTARTHLEREDDLTRIAELRLRGFSQEQIARKLDLSQPQVSRDLKELERRWLKAQIRSVDAHKTQKLVELDYLKTESWEAWDRSQQEAIEQSASKAKKNGDAVEEAERKSKSQVGDPRFLEMVHKTIGTQAEILGLYAPIKTKTELSGRNGGAIEIKKTTASREEIIRELQRRGITVNAI